MIESRNNLANALIKAVSIRFVISISACEKDVSLHELLCSMLEDVEMEILILRSLRRSRRRSAPANNYKTIFLLFRLLAIMFFVLTKRLRTNLRESLCVFVKTLAIKQESP